MLKIKKRKARLPRSEFPSDARFSLRAAFVLMTVVAYWALGTTRAMFAGRRSGPHVEAPTALDLLIPPADRDEVERMLAYRVPHGAA